MFLPPIIAGLMLLLGRRRMTQKLLDAERRYGTARSSARAVTPERARSVSRFVVVWCVLFIGLAVAGLVQNLSLSRASCRTCSPAMGRNSAPQGSAVLVLFGAQQPVARLHA